jgi:hypothetical protein
MDQVNDEKGFHDLLDKGRNVSRVDISIPREEIHESAVEK